MSKHRILFVGQIDSSHARSWIDLLGGTEHSIVCFNMTRVPLDASFRYPVVSTSGLSFFAPPRFGLPTLFAKLLTAFSIALRRDLHDSMGRWFLALLIRFWKPDIIHCFGATTAGLFYNRAREKYRLRGLNHVIVQARGGPDLEDGSLEPGIAAELRRLFQVCDRFVADNAVGYEIAAALGCSAHKLEPRRIFPGTGGMDISAIRVSDLVPPSKRDRLIFVPKAYEGYQSKVLPLLEALQRIWPKIAPARVVLTAVNAEARTAVTRLPESFRVNLEMHSRLPRQAVLEIMRTARVVAAPSILDGIPNVLYEAMAAGAAPLVSPLTTITPVISAPRNTLFARNLYIDELEAALLRLMTDDDLADQMAQNNFADVAVLADRTILRKHILSLYDQGSPG